jgi:hypothetical protein
MSGAPPGPTLKFGRRDTGIEHEVKLFVPTPTIRPQPRKGTKPLDLSGLVPAWLLLGGNNSGKTTWARWAVGRALESGRSVKAVGDFGGSGEEYLHSVLEDSPTIVDDLATAGSGIIAAYFLTPRSDDLQVLAALNARGFKPKATVFVLNEFHVERGANADEAFRRILDHSVFKAAVANGAHVVRMPRLYPQALSLEIASKHLQFSHARDGTVPDGSTVTPIRGLDCSRVRRWLTEMEAAHEGVKGGLP